MTQVPTTHSLLTVDIFGFRNFHLKIFNSFHELLMNMVLAFSLLPSSWILSAPKIDVVRERGSVKVCWCKGSLTMHVTEKVSAYEDLN